MLVQASRNVTLDFEILPLENLIPHEQTIPSLLESVIRDFERTGYQRDPIIIDTKTKLVLDGMHRRGALEAIGSHFALCAAFDYLDETTVLQRWLRYFIAPDRQFIQEIIGLFDLESVENTKKGMELVDAKQSPIALLSSRQSYISKEHNDLQSVYQRLADFDKLASEREIAVEFRSETEGDALFLSGSVFVLYPLAFTKHDIIQAGEDHQLFPYKTTRHVVPVRPMGIFFPLDLLKNGTTELCNLKLQEIIERSKIDLIEANSWYEGRRYSEPLAIFKRDL